MSGGKRVKFSDLDHDVHVPCASAAIGAADGADVAIVTADGEFDVAGVGLATVSGVPGLPSIVRQEDFDPGMRGLVFIPGFAIEEVAADITGWNALAAAEASVWTWVQSGS